MRLSLPWWFKIIGYLLSFCIVVVCLFFTIIKGISFGDDTSRKWLTSFLISLLTSICLTQPIQVVLLSIFFVLLFRNSNDQGDLEYDSNDDGKPINKINVSEVSGIKIRAIKNSTIFFVRILMIRINSNTSSQHINHKIVQF